MMRLKRKFNLDAEESSSALTGNSSLGAVPHHRRNDNPNMVSLSSGSASGSVNVGSVDLGIDMTPLMEGMDPNSHDKKYFELYRDIYWHDATCGCATDMFSTMPYSEFSIGGGTDKQLAPYREAVEVLGLRTSLTGITIDQLVTGTHVSSIVHNRSDKKFIDLMSHKIENADISPLPFMSQDPIIDMRVSEEVKKVLSRTDSPRLKALVNRLGSGFVEKLMSGQMELDPLSTLYLPRRTFSFGEGTSWYKRVLPIYLIEKNLFKGTLVESGKRQRGIMHIQAGDGDQWEPALEELEFITDLFQNADLDPLGSIVATRLGVNVDEFRQGGDFWKVTDIWDQTAQMKLRALGMNDSFLSGEAQFAYEQQGSITVFMESLKAFRDNMTRNIFYNKVFPLVAMMNGLAVNAKGRIINKDNLMDGDIEDKLRTMNDGSKLFIPTVHWSKALSSEADLAKLDLLDRLTQMNIPVPIRAMAAAGGFNLDSLLSNQAEDLAVQRKLYEYKKRHKELGEEYGVGGDDMGGGGGFGSFSAASSVLGNSKPRGFNRDFDPEIVGRTKTGKKKWLYDQKRANSRANDEIIKSLNALKTQPNFLSKSSITPKVQSRAELIALSNVGLY